MAGSQATFQLLGGSILTVPVLAHLWALCPHSRSTAGAWLYQTQVKLVQVTIWEHKGPSANHFAAL